MAGTLSSIESSQGLDLVARRRGRPLGGVRVVSLAQNVPGPVAVSRLVAAGAAVVKIEPPDGDPLAGLNRAWYRQLHRRVTIERLDLKSLEGHARLHVLLDKADLLVTSQRPSALGRLGLTSRRLIGEHPRLHWVSIVGDVRHPERPGHDLTYQADAGLLGHDMPRTLLADLLGAERAVQAALLLLRGGTPRVTRVGLRDALNSAARPVQLGLTTPGGALGGALPTYRLYESRAGLVAVAALEPHFRRRLYDALALDEGADLAEVMRTRTARQWERWAVSRDLPIARVKA